MNPTTPWLYDTWTEAVAATRRTWTGTPLERVARLAVARAGRSAIAFFRSGELRRLTQLTEEELHEIVEAGIEARRFGAESHPMAIILVDHLPAYVEPPPGSTPVPGMVGTRVRYRGDGTVRTIQPVIVEDGVRRRPA